MLRAGPYSRIAMKFSPFRVNFGDSLAGQHCQYQSFKQPEQNTPLTDWPLQLFKRMLAARPSLENFMDFWFRISNYRSFLPFLSTWLDGDLIVASLIDSWSVFGVKQHHNVSSKFRENLVSFNRSPMKHLWVWMYMLTVTVYLRWVSSPCYIQYRHRMS